jgi:hypothetical protein
MRCAFSTIWQTLAAGLLALVAGGITVFGTLAAANRQVKAANESADHQIKAAAAAADRQVAAAQEQTQAAQRQTAVMREIERRRIAREGYAFHSMLEAAMSAVIEDVAAARNLPPPSPGSEAYSVQAYAVRQSVRRTGFNELRNAFLRFGGTLTTQNFLQLDKEIEDFARQWLPAPPGNPALYSMVRPPIGVNAGLQEQLDRIESRAIALREEATIGMRLCRDELAKEAINLES